MGPLSLPPCLIVSEMSFRLRVSPIRCTGSVVSPRRERGPVGPTEVVSRMGVGDDSRGSGGPTDPRATCGRLRVRVLGTGGEGLVRVSTDLRTPQCRL